MLCSGTLIALQQQFGVGCLCSFCERTIPIETGFPMADTQISARISGETRDQVERYTGAHGLKKGALVEQALLHHLQALRELPADVIIPPRLELSEASFERVARLIAKPRTIKRGINLL